MNKTLLAASAFAVLGLSACAVTPTPYQPINLPGANASGGFSELRLEQNRFRVNFSGNTYTERQTVENYLLLRAAELTVSQGYDWFTAVERDTERSTRYRDTGFGGSRFGGFGGFGYGGFYPSYRYYGRYGWSPFYDPFLWDRDVDIREINRYQATTEIVMGRGPQPANDPRVFNAREVVANLAPIARAPV